MASARGRLSLLAIVTIFLVVFGTMYAGVEYARGDLIDREEPSELERQLGDHVREAVDEARADRGLEPAQSDTSTRVEARATAVRLTTMDYFVEPTAVGVRPDADGSLPNTKGLCRRVPLKLTVTHPAWNASEGATVPDAVTRHVADRVVDLYANDAGTDVLGRSNAQQHGIGVAVEGNVVYVVYRLCNLGY
jgi:hypothetical protein